VRQRGEKAVLVNIGGCVRMLDCTVKAKQWGYSPESKDNERV